MAWTYGQWPRDSEPNRCRNLVEFVREAPEGAVLRIDMRGTRPCGGRLNDGKCEFCDVTTIEEVRR